jgi:ADP-dependent NAD(P)H-hydrate dehydratase / NAD(P)H-hydrate epimerase
MKIFSAAQIKEWDAYTIVNEPITSSDLMERAAQKCTEWLTNIEIDHHPIKIFCGKGNNGGDGLAIARQLAEQGIFSRIYILELGGTATAEFEENLHKLRQYIEEIHFIKDEYSFPLIKKEDLVIDALFGIGLNRPLEGLSAGLVKHINSFGQLIVSIDIPSGMFADQSSYSITTVKTTHTLTFQIPKLAFLLPENDELVGDLHILDIQLHKQFAAENESNFEFVNHQFVKRIYKPRKKFSHKGTFGHSIIVAGSIGKMGAAHLSAKACLRSGVGLLSCLIPLEGVEILQTSLPEAMCLTTQEIEKIDWNIYASVGIGPGLGTGEQAIRLLIQVLEGYDKPMVIDADALNILSQNKKLVEKLPKGSILTPHPKEYERLFGSTANSFDRLKSALAWAGKLQSVIIVKGHYSFVACPDGKGFFNSTGNAGMATAGSGDVLTGILTALLAQGYAPESAALFGVYLHGLSGDLASNAWSQEAMIAGDIINCLGIAFQKIDL